MSTQSILISVCFYVLDFFKPEAIPLPLVLLDELPYCPRRSSKSTNSLTTKSWYFGRVYNMCPKIGKTWVEHREPLTMVATICI